MKIEIRKHLYLAGFLMFTLLMSSFGLMSGCSKKGVAESEGNKQNAGAKTEEMVTQNIVYNPIQEKILDSIREKYSPQGIEIVNIELSNDAHDQVKIDIRFREHTEAQAVLAGMNILQDNFPRMKGYHASGGGEEYSSTPDVLTYITRRGYTIYCNSENAEYYLEIITNGIPKDDGGSVNTESK